MTEKKIRLPAYMERTLGFTIPQNGRFYVFYFDDLVYYDISKGVVEERDSNWDFDDETNLVFLDGQEIPFVGLWGGDPILKREDLGILSLQDSKVTLERPDGKKQLWDFSNFSGDWEQVTFDRVKNAFIFGAPYDFDYRYIEIT